MQVCDPANFDDKEGGEGEEGKEADSNRLEAIRRVIEKLDLHPYELNADDDLYEPVRRGQPFIFPTRHWAIMSVSALIGSPFNPRRDEGEILISVKSYPRFKRGEERPRARELTVRIYHAKREAVTGLIHCKVPERMGGKFRVWKYLDDDRKVSLTYLGPAREGRVKWMDLKGKGKSSVSESHSEGEDREMIDC